VNAAIANIKTKRTIEFVDWCPTGFKVINSIAGNNLEFFHVQTRQRIPPLDSMEIYRFFTFLQISVKVFLAFLQDHAMDFLELPRKTFFHGIQFCRII